MLIKWIVCKVPESKKDRFSSAQEQWSEIKRIDGFLGQIGGWNRNQPTEACIMAFWRDAESYQNFMDHIHDRIFHTNNQVDTFDSISVAIAESRFDIPVVKADIVLAIQDAQILRVSECISSEGWEQYFPKIQGTIPNPGLASLNGMLAGVFGSVRNRDHQYLMASLWTYESDRETNVLTGLLGLRAQLHDGIQQVEERVIVLENRWTVLGGR